MLDKYSEAIGEVATKLLKNCTDDYASRIWTAIEEDVVADVLECSAAAKDGGFTDGDVALAVGRTIHERLKVMTPNQYQEAAMRTCPIKCPEDNPMSMIINGTMGLCGESGEVIDLAKKHIFQGHDLDKTHIAKELGDVAWYLAETAKAIGYDLETIFRMNIEKLWARYPDGFDPEHSLHRAKGDV